jgi:hypothetical protein
MCRVVAKIPAFLYKLKLVKKFKQGAFIVPRKYTREKLKETEYTKWKSKL